MLADIFFFFEYDASLFFSQLSAEMRRRVNCTHSPFDGADTSMKKASGLRHSGPGIHDGEELPIGMMLTHE